METLKLAPLTNDHPNVAVTSQNVKKFQVGIVGEQIEPAENIYLGSMVTIMDADAIRDVEAGVEELSCGYDCQIDEAPGEYEGQPYDVIQRMIRYNHVALVPKGRAGRNVKLRLDSQEAIQLSTEEQAMEEIEINGQKFQVQPEVAAAFKAHMDKYKTDMDAAKKDMAPVAELQKAKEEKEAAEAEKVDAVKKADEAQAKLDSATAELAKRTDSADKIEAIAKELIKARKVASIETKLDSADIDKKSVNELKTEVLKAHKVDVTGKSQDYINARYDSIAERADLEDAEREKSRKAFEARFNPRKDADIPDSQKKRAEMVERQKTKWKTNPADNANNQ